MTRSCVRINDCVSVFDECSFPVFFILTQLDKRKMLPSDQKGVRTCLRGQKRRQENDDACRSSSEPLLPHVSRRRVVTRCSLFFNDVTVVSYKTDSISSSLVPLSSKLASSRVRERIQGSCFSRLVALLVGVPSQSIHLYCCAKLHSRSVIIDERQRVW